MLWLVQANHATAGKPDLGDRTPPRLLNFGAFNISLRKASHLCFQVVANEIQFVRASFIGRVECGFSWWQGKDQPAVTRIDEFEPEHITEECTIRLGVLGVD